MRQYFSVSSVVLLILCAATAVFAQTQTPTVAPVIVPTPSSTYILNWDNLGQNYRAGGRHFQSSAVMSHRLWIMGGESSNLPVADVWSSIDGLNWSAATTQAAFGARWGQASVVFDVGQGPNLWVIGGSDNKGFFNDVWQSKDGTNWTQTLAAAPFGQRVRESAVVFNHKMWVIGGRNSSAILNDVWCSADGKTWTQVSAAAAFPPRYSASLLVYNNSLWLIAGQGNAGPLGDVWTSTDGVNWSNVLANPEFEPRASQSAVVFNGLMWVLGGHDVTTQTVFADAWWSNNGSQWYQAVTSKDYTSRWAQTSEVFNHKIWMITGATGTQMKPVDYADIWDGSLTTGTNVSSAMVASSLNSSFNVVGQPTTTSTVTATATMTITAKEGLNSTATPTMTATIAVMTPTITPTIGTVAIAYPNPCTGAQVNLNLPLRQPGDVRVEIFTIGSRRVRTCVFRQQPVGQDVTLTLVDNGGTTLANGLYFVRVTTPESSNILKLLVIR